ncbi:MAG: penicillin-binding protein 2 [Paludibacteraceae bacterium]|nr:penicillin-binding protein 2 [Paludibacteraceae bacterium]
MSDQQTHMILRFATIFFLIVIGFVCVIAQIIKVQNSEEEIKKWQPIEQSQVKTDIVIQPNRGNILDAHRNMLASSVPQYYVYMDTRVEALHLDHDSLFNLYVDSIAQGLSRILKDTTPQYYHERMTRAFHATTNKHRDIKVTPRRVNYIEKKQIEQLPLVRCGYYKSGFHYDNQHLRSKPYGSLGSRTIGNIYQESGQGYAGLEKSMESYLHGKEGLSRRQKVAGHMDDIPIIEAEDGCNIITTLDAELMDICESSLRKQLAVTQADWGCCILMETHTGEIKAISNLDRIEDGRYVEKENHAVRRVEPGSTFKTISLLAILDDGKMDIDDSIRVTAKPWVYYTVKHTDSHPKDTVYTLRSALAVSSNIAFAKMVTTAYEGEAEKYVKKLRKMGICDSLGIEIPGVEAPRIDIPDDRVTISKMAYGYSVEVSPLQLVTIYNAIANNGRMVKPMIIKSIERNGEVVEKYKTQTLHSYICSETALRQVRLALHDVVWDNKLGTAAVRKWAGKITDYKAQSELVHIAGKTGTAQLFLNGQYTSGKHRITFVGYFPEEKPEYTCICMINHPHNYKAYDAGWDCGRVVREIAEKTMAYAGVYVIKDGQKVWTKTR